MISIFFLQNINFLFFYYFMKGEEEFGGVKKPLPILLAALEGSTPSIFLETKQIKIIFNKIKKTTLQSNNNNDNWYL